MELKNLLPLLIFISLALNTTSISWTAGDYYMDNYESCLPRIVSAGMYECYGMIHERFDKIWEITKEKKYLIEYPNGAKVTGECLYSATSSIQDP